jgi:hypothetical protein
MIGVFWAYIYAIIGFFVRDEMLRLAATALLRLAYVCLWDYGAVGLAILVASIAGAGTLAGIDRAIEVQAVPAPAGRA